MAGRRAYALHGHEEGREEERQRKRLLDLGRRQGDAERGRAEPEVLPLLHPQAPQPGRSVVDGSCIHAPTLATIGADGIGKRHRARAGSPYGASREHATESLRRRLAALQRELTAQWSIRTSRGALALQTSCRRSSSPPRRAGSVDFVLKAFRIDAGVEAAALVVVLNGAATVVPVPGRAGSQQVLAMYALQGDLGDRSGGVLLSMQVGVTVVNTTVGLAALMILFRTWRPVTALRAAGRKGRLTLLRPSSQPTRTTLGEHARGIFERILCGVDGSPESLEAVRQSDMLLAPRGKLLLVAVVDPTQAIHLRVALSGVHAARHALEEVEERDEAAAELSSERAPR